MTHSSPETLTNLHNGLFADCPAFREFLDRWFAVMQTKEDERYLARDMLSSAWDAGVDAALGVSLTREERRERAERIDALYMDRNE